MSPVVEAALVPPVPVPVPPVPVVPLGVSLEGQPRRPMDRTAAIRTNHLLFIRGFPLKEAGFYRRAVRVTRPVVGTSRQSPLTQRRSAGILPPGQPPGRRRYR